MNRSKKLAVLSHCILNQNAVVKGEYKDMNVFFSFVQELFGNFLNPCSEIFQLFFVTLCLPR